MLKMLWNRRKSRIGRTKTLIKQKNSLKAENEKSNSLANSVENVKIES
jgi:hypothetical protein